MRVQEICSKETKHVPAIQKTTGFSPAGALFCGCGGGGRFPLHDQVDAVKKLMLECLGF